MPTVCVVGAQWGDEGKAGIVDLLGSDADLVVRFQGGPNAGHTVVVGGETFKLHLIPSGMVRPGLRCLIGQGVVVDLEVLFHELDSLDERDVTTAGRMFVSDRAHLILPYHRVLDGLKEASAKRKIGTTLKGIGPCYADKVSYQGIRVGDLLQPEWFAERLKAQVDSRNRLIEKVYGGTPLVYEEILAVYEGYRDRLAPMVVDGSEFLYDTIEDGKKVLFEGAQGFLLDVDAGTYPYVTGSNASSLGLSAGAGLSPKKIERIIGVTKAYCTRVGEGPFPTEDHGVQGDLIRERGQEFGTTTGRPRRCGWFDAVAIRYAARTSGFDELAVTKLDILAGVETLKVGVGYEYRGERIDRFPAALSVLDEAKPVYREFEGFATDIQDVRHFDDLPETARTYLLALEEITGVPIGLVSVGPERDQVIRRS